MRVNFENAVIITIVLLVSNCVWIQPVGGQLLGPADKPRLVLEGGGHIDIIREIIFTKDGNELISVGDDKTIRIWTVSSDGRTGALKRVIRGQIEEGRSGSIYGLAISPPDAAGIQRWLAVGGYLAGPDRDRYAVRLHNYATGEVVALLHGHTNLINGLAFSPNGRWLASASKDKTIRIWDLSHFQPQTAIPAPLVLRGHEAPVYDVAWSPHMDRLVSAAYDKTVGLWNTEGLITGDVHLIKRLTGHQKPVRTVAFHPGGDVFASGAKDKTIRIWEAAGGQPVKVIHAKSEVTGLSFSPNGHLLLSGSSDARDTNQRATVFEFPSGKIRHIFTEHDNVVVATAFHPSGRFVATGGGNNKEILLWNPEDGEILSRLEGMGRTIQAVGFSADGRYIGWGQTLDYQTINNKGPLEKCFDLVDLKTADCGAMVRAIDHVGDYGLTTERGGPHNYSYRLTIEKPGWGWDDVTIERGEQDGYRHSAYTFTPDGRYILSGGFSGYLALYDLNGVLVKRLKGHTGEIKAVAVSPDGRWAVSGASDQTVRLWLLDNHKKEIVPTLSVFPSRNNWIAWTPEGFFACAKERPDQIGYSLNQGVDKTAQYVSIDQLYDRFYRPDLIYTRLHGDPEAFWRKEEASQTVPEILVEEVPPRVLVLKPNGSRDWREPDIDVKIGVVDQGGGIGKIVWKLNQVTLSVVTTVSRSLKVVKATDHSRPTITLTKNFVLDPGPNKLEVTAFSKHGHVASVPVGITLAYVPSPGPQSASNRAARQRADRQPNLYVLTVGINKYLDHALWLHYAVNDARSIEQKVTQTGRPLFKRIQCAALYDKQANWAVLDTTFKAIAKKIRPQDVFIFYVAGHGLTLDGRYYFLPYDFVYNGDGSVKRSAISQNNFQTWLSTIKARKSLILLDTCQSGSFAESLSVMRGIAQKTAVNKLIRATGRATIVAATDIQPALEGYKNHGVFTYVFLEGLAKADANFGNRDNIISVMELAQYLDDQVPVVTKQNFDFEQFPQVNLLGSDFPIGLVNRTSEVP